MNENKLSRRLETVASFIPENSKLADIGSDHAYLPCYTVLNGVVAFAIAGEVNEGPFQSAVEQVRKNDLGGSVIVRKGDGLEVISKAEVDCITIAGMGGQLITSILENGKEKLDGVKRLILQPNVGAISIRKWLLDNEWELIDEAILEEDEKVYEILVAERGQPNRPYEKNNDSQLLFGPFLLKNKNDAFYKKWMAEKNQWLQVINQLQAAVNDEEVDAKKKEVLRKIEMAEEVLS
jgi:tRNA (adenine22-N1)-methyltransferase